MTVVAECYVSGSTPSPYRQGGESEIRPLEG